jgi:hypothetical protein
MSAANLASQGFSADVQMHLRVNGHMLRIGQLGPDFLILDDPIDQPSGPAEIAMSINGRKRQWQVHLPDGVSAGERLCAIRQDRD